MAVKKHLKRLLPFFLLLFLSGCWDKIELEDVALVTTIGLDKGSLPGRVDVTLQIMNAQKATIALGNPAEKEPDHINVTLRNTTPILVKDQANAVITRRINISQVQAFLISEALARDVDLYQIIAAMIRDPEMRRETPVIITKERAETFIKHNRPKFETLIYAFYRFKLNRWKDTGDVPLSNVNDFLRAHADGAPYLFIYATTERKKAETKGQGDDTIAGRMEVKGGDPAEMIGAAIIHKGKMIGTLTGEETRFTLLLGQNLRIASYYVAFPDPDHKPWMISTRIKNEMPPTIDVDLKGKRPHITLTVPLYVEVLSIPSNVDYVADMRLQNKLARYLEQTMHKTFMDLVQKAQQTWKADIFNWYRFARSQFLTWSAYEAYDFEKRFQDAEVTLHVKLQMIDFGKQLRPEDTLPPLKGKH
ncbi:MAG: Ger(x)C family spore germination protein [Candidatus Carbobacillus sp.]|nr:Ger(x)C family spore germination protein [Candidatus Carbobacillus sp.]